MIISIVVAAGENNAIGANNDLLWKLPQDMRFFKNLTWGMPVVMGRKTFESMGSKPLPGRTNIVISTTLEMHPGVHLASNMEHALSVAADTDCKEVFVIGGGQIYADVLDRADCIYMTRVHGVFPHADTFFPDIDQRVFSCDATRSVPADERHAHAFTFETWKRI